MAKGSKKRIPKQIGGMKVPKELRRAGEAAIDTVAATITSPEGKAVIAGGLSLAATALIAAAERHRAKSDGNADVAEGTAASSQPGAGDAVGEAMDRLLSGLFGKRAG